MNPSPVQELLGLLRVELEQLEALSEARLAQNNELLAENTRLRSQLSEDLADGSLRQLAHAGVLADLGDPSQIVRPPSKRKISRPPLPTKSPATLLPPSVVQDTWITGDESAEVETESSTTPESHGRAPDTSPDSVAATHFSAPRAPTTPANRMLRVPRLSKRKVGAIGQFSRTDLTECETPRARWVLPKGPWTLKAIVQSSTFDITFSCLIFCHAVIMALEAQYQGIDIGRDIAFPGYGRPATELWPNAEDAFRLLGRVFGSVFLFEVIVKAVALRVEFVKSAWNLFDTLVVCLWLFEQIASSVSLNPMFFRLMRLVRLVRLARMVKTIQAFDSLQVLLGSIVASVSALLWSSLLLLLIQMIFGLLLNSLLADFMGDASKSEASRREVYSYFGTFSRSMISMFELTLANWPTICWTLVDKVNEWFGILILAYKLGVGFAVLAVVTGVFLHETFKVASSDDELMLVQKQRATKNHVRKMERLFKEADTSQDGVIDKEEFETILKIPKVKTWLSAMELEVGDSGLLFDFLDDGDKQITIAELIDGVARLKGGARNIDVIALMHSCRKIHILVEELTRRMDCIAPNTKESDGERKSTVGVNSIGLESAAWRRSLLRSATLLEEPMEV